jgi:hypothetical protein
MRNKSWQTTLGGALSAAGSMMVGIGVIPQLGGQSNKLLSWVALVGFFLNVAGTFFAHLFAADAVQLASVQRQMLKLPNAIDTGDTSQLFKTKEQQTETPKTP